MYLKITEVAKRLCVCDNTIRKVIEDGYLPAIKVGSQLRIDDEDLETFIQRNTMNAKTEADKAPV